MQQVRRAKKNVLLKYNRVHQRPPTGACTYAAPRSCPLLFPILPILSLSLSSFHAFHASMPVLHTSARHRTQGRCTNQAAYKFFSPSAHSIVCTRRTLPCVAVWCRVRPSSSVFVVEGHCVLEAAVVFLRMAVLSSLSFRFPPTLSPILFYPLLHLPCAPSRHA